MTTEERLDKLERELLPAKPRPVSLAAVPRSGSGGSTELYVLWDDGKVAKVNVSMNLSR